MRRCELRNLHLVTYENGMRMQETLVAMRQRDEIDDQLLLLEHPPVITLGRGGDMKHLLVAPEMLSTRGVRYYETTRGGDITYHGPGQIVGYPIVHLGEGKRDVRKYVEKIEEVLIRTAAHYGIRATRWEGNRGVWVGREKLAAIGVRVARWVTSHGFALNVDPDLDHFRLITPCGIRGAGVTSLTRLTGSRVQLDEVREVVARHFADVFERELVRREHDLRLVKIVVHDGWRLLLLHRSQQAGDFWQPITGMIEEGESEAAAAAREITEETGWTAEVAPLGLRQSFVIDPEWIGSDRPLFTDETAYVAEIDSSMPIVVDGDEHDGYGWFTPEEARTKIQWTDDREAIDRVEKRLRASALPAR